MKLKELDAMWEELIAEGRQFYRCGASLFEQAMRKAIAAERARYDKLHELVEEFGPAGLNASVIAHWEKAKREREARVLRFVATSWRHEFPLNDHAHAWALELDLTADRVESGELKVPR